MNPVCWQCLPHHLEDTDGADYPSVCQFLLKFSKEGPPITYLEGLNGVLGIADDILIHGNKRNEQNTITDHNRNLEALLQRLHEPHIALNRDNVRLQQTAVSFLGYVLSSTGVKKTQRRRRQSKKSLILQGWPKNKSNLPSLQATPY